MTPNDYSFNHALIDLVKSGEVAESRLDLSCRRILWVKKQLGILDSPMPNFEAYDKFASIEHKQAALATAEESITLLKNNENLLPLDKSANILVCGPAAHSLNIQNGAWTHTWQGVDTAYNTAGVNTIYESLEKYSEGHVDYVLGSSLFEQIDIQKAVKAARNADVIVVCLGEIPSTEKPGDIDDLYLPPAQGKLVKELSKLGKPVVFALVFNRPMIIREIEPLANAILQCYLPGDYGGEALARILYGEVNPSGKLPFTYPRYTGTFVPYDHKYTETLDKTFGRNAFNPQWEFGFGLSYSRFEYNNLKLDSDAYAKDGQIQVSFTVTNSSDRPGKEVVQVYITDRVASITPSVKRLRAFEKIAIGAHDSVEVNMRIPISELSFVGKDNLWVIQEGEFVLNVADNSVTFEVK